MVEGFDSVGISSLDVTQRVDLPIKSCMKTDCTYMPIEVFSTDALDHCRIGASGN
jgi:hypothetical protein